jgi:hypothetical protein
MTQLDARQRPHPKPSARAKLELVRSDRVRAPSRGEPQVKSFPSGSSVRPELSCQVESFRAIAYELPPLFERHYAELAENKDVYPLDPDWERYFMLEATGTLRMMTARCEGVLAGYISNLVGPHLHSRQTIFAEIEMFWLDPVYRGGWFAMKWFRENDAYLKSLGVKLVHVSEKLRFKDGRAGLIFKRLGYRPIEMNFVKAL